MSDTVNGTSKVPERIWLFEKEFGSEYRYGVIEHEVYDLPEYILKSLSDKKVGREYGKGYDEGYGKGYKFGVESNEFLFKNATAKSRLSGKHIREVYEKYKKHDNKWWNYFTPIDPPIVFKEIWHAIKKDLKEDEEKAPN